MNLTDMINAMKNPSGFVMQQFMQRAIAEHPEQWQQCQQMFQGKSRKQQLNELAKLYKSKGMDLNTTARQYGIQL